MSLKIEDVLAVFTGVEVQRQGEALRLIKHRSKLYKIVQGQVAYWIF